MTDEQFLVLVALLTDIRDVLTHGMQPGEDVVEGCPHPEDKRVSLATPREPDHWICSLPNCRYEHHGVTHN